MVRKAYLASIVPVIVNAVLNEHQVIVDIVAFVAKGDFPRSRLGEKQRGKILASWVTRKLNTIAQFGIRDADGADSQITEVAEPRSGLGSTVNIGSSLKNVETVTSPPALERQVQDYTSLPAGISEMPVYESSIVESPRLPSAEEPDRDMETPTEPRHDHNNHFEHTNTTTDSYDPNAQEPSYITYGPNKDLPLPPSDPAAATSPDEYPDYQAYPIQPTPSPSDPIHSFAFDPDPPPPPARYDSKPTLSLPPSTAATTLTASNGTTNISSPDDEFGNNNKNNRSSVIPIRGGELSRDDYAPRTSSRGGMSHTPSSGSSDHYTMDEEWRREASGYLHLARDGSRGHSTGGEYEGAGYGHAL